MTVTPPRERAAQGAADTATNTEPGEPRADEFADIAAMSYETAREELVGVVARLERGGETLETSLNLWERGAALAARCQEWLDGARQRLDAVRHSSPTGESLDPISPDA